MGFEYDDGANTVFSVVYPQEWAAGELPAVVREVLAQLNALDNAVQNFWAQRALQSAADYRSFLFELGVIWFERNGMILLDYWAVEVNMQWAVYLQKSDAIWQIYQDEACETLLAVAAA